MSWMSVIFRMRWRTRFLRRGWIFMFIGRVCKFIRMRQERRSWVVSMVHSIL